MVETERTIRTFKHSARKYFYSNNNINTWDEHIDKITNAINTSINTYQHSPEEIMFGQKANDKIDLLKLDDLVRDQSPSIDTLMDRANKIRDNYDKNKKIKEAKNTTYKNKSATKKLFSLGDLVLHRQLQVSTGSSSKWKPVFTGPYVIESINADKTIHCRHLVKDNIIKAHTSNVTAYKIDRSTNKLNDKQLSQPIFNE